MKTSQLPSLSFACSLLCTTDYSDESTLSKSLTMVAGSQSGHSKKSGRDSKSTSSSSGGGGGNGSGVVGGSGAVVAGAHCETESDTSISPSTEFSNMPTYRVPCKSTRNTDGRVAAGAYGHGGHASKPVARYLYIFSDMFRPDSSTESNNEQSSPVERRISGRRQLGEVPEDAGIAGGRGGSGESDRRAHRGRKQQQQQQAKEHQTLERRICPGSNNR